MRERNAVKAARSVLWGGRNRKASLLPDSEEVSVMGMERRTEQLISWSKSQLRVSDNTHAERGTTSTMWLKLTKGKGNNAWRNKEYL